MLPLLRMCTASEMRERFERLRDNITPITTTAMMENKEPLEQLLVHQQYNENVDSSGKPLRQYSKQYRFYKGQTEGRGNVTDLNYTGEFQSTIALRTDDSTGEFEYDSPALTDDGQLKSVWLTKWNEAKGGTSVMELAPDNLDAVFPIIREQWVDQAAAIVAGTE